MQNSIPWTSEKGLEAPGPYHRSACLGGIRIERPLQQLLCALLCLVWIGLNTARAEEKPIRVLTLQEALSLAAEQSKDIQKAKEVRNKVMGRYIEERAAAMPRLTVGTSTAKAGDASQKAFGGGFFKDMPTSQYSFASEAQVDQVLYSWGQVGAAIRAAKEGLADADDQLRIYQQAVARDVSVAFYDVLLAKEMRQITLSNLEQKQRHLDEARKKYEMGTATDYDILAAEVELQNARPAIIRADNIIRTAQERLRFLIGHEGEAVDAVGELASAVVSYPSYELVLDQAVKNRPDLMELEHQEGIGKELIKIYSAGNKPRLDFRSGFGYRHLSIGNGHEGGLAYQAGVFMTFPAWDGGRTRGKVLQAQSDLSTLRIQRAQLVDGIALQVRDAVNAVREAGEVAQALAGTVTQAEKLLSMAEKGFELGVKTKLDVDDAQLNLLQAKTNLAKARRDYQAARITLDWVSGSIKL